MRVVAGSGVARDFRQAEIDRHIEMVSRFVERAKDHGPALRAVTLILRSASSGPARALIYKKDELIAAGIRAKAILAKLEPEAELRELFASLTELAPREKAPELIRWARNPRLLDAHEQATYGNTMCWSGDAMRRDADKRNALALFDEAAADGVRLGRLAFAALWSVSSPVPERLLLGVTTPKPSGAYHASPDAPVTMLRPSLQGWPLVRH
jgi:hypothetical protein